MEFVNVMKRNMIDITRNNKDGKIVIPVKDY